MAPVRAVGGPSDVGVVVGGVFASGGFGPRDEGDVVGFEDEAGGVDRGGDNDGGGAEAEVHDWAVFEGEVVDGAVRERAH